LIRIADILKKANRKAKDSTESKEDKEIIPGPDRQCVPDQSPSHAPVQQPQPALMEEQKMEGNEDGMQGTDPAVKRTNVAYPVEFKLFSSQNDCTSFSGLVQNMSVDGACIQFEDRYGRLDLDELPGSKVKITISIPQGEKATIHSVIQWISRDISQSFLIRTGIEFVNLEDWQLKAVEKLIGLKNQDRNMMWSLLEQYEKKS
jgi:hypothetical protein